MTPVEIAARAHYEASGAGTPAWDKLEFWRPHSIKLMEATFAALQAAGYKVVPREATEDMASAAAEAFPEGVADWALSVGDAPERIWAAMWDKAP